MKGGFGFPVSPKYETLYRADTSRKKAELIETLRYSEKLWNTEAKQQQSILQLRKALAIIKFIINNESIEDVKQTYIDKEKELKSRLANRQDGKQEIYIGNNNEATNRKKNTGGTGGGNNKEKNEFAGQINEAIVTEKPDVHWDDVSGLQNAKNALKQAVIMPLRFPQIFKGGRKPWTGILLYGPPGTGKTYLAKACATEAQSTFFSISSSDVMSKYVGESQKLIKQLFAVARSKKPSVIFIDEIDSMCGSRSDNENEASRRVKTQFLVQMQGVGHDETGVLILGATNLPWALDPAIRRRFQRRIYIPLPEYPSRLHMLKNNMKNNKNSLAEKDFEDIASKTDMFSGSDISVLVRDAIYQPVRRLQSATEFKEINGRFFPCREGEIGTVKGTWVSLPNDKIDIEETSKADFDYALTRTKPSVDKKQLKEYEDFTKNFGQQG